MAGNAAFFQTIKPVFGGHFSQSQVDGLNYLLDYRARKYPKVTDEQMAYILATVTWETGRSMRPIHEGGSKSYLQSKPYYPYTGRGYVQLTWRKNYEHYGIADSPDKALEPETAAYILFDGILNGVFGGKLGSYVNNTKCDYLGARRCVNVQDKAKEIAAIANKYKAALALQAKDPVEVVAHVPTPPPEDKGLFDEIGDFFNPSWAQAPRNTPIPQAQAPTIKGQAGFIVAAIVAVIGALQAITAQDWSLVLTTPNHEGLQQIILSIVIAIANVYAPTWVRIFLPRPKYHS